MLSYCLRVMLLLCLLGAGIVGWQSQSLATEPTPQGIYVPVYSSVIYGNKERELRLATMLVVRNIDTQHPIVLHEVRYIDEDGKTVLQFLKKPLSLAPLSSTRFVIAERDGTGGLSPSFIVGWSGQEGTAPPWAQGVMVGTAGSQGISFMTEGRAMLVYP